MPLVTDEELCSAWKRFLEESKRGRQPQSENKHTQKKKEKKNVRREKEKKDVSFFDRQKVTKEDFEALELQRQKNEREKDKKLKEQREVKVDKTSLALVLSRKASYSSECLFKALASHGDVLSFLVFEEALREQGFWPLAPTPEQSLEKDIEENSLCISHYSTLEDIVGNHRETTETIHALVREALRETLWPENEKLREEGKEEEEDENEDEELVGHIVTQGDKIERYNTLCRLINAELERRKNLPSSTIIQRTVLHKAPQEMNDLVVELCNIIEDQQHGFEVYAENFKTLVTGPKELQNYENVKKGREGKEEEEEMFPFEPKLLVKTEKLGKRSLSRKMKQLELLEAKLERTTSSQLHRAKSSACIIARSLPRVRHFEAPDKEDNFKASTGQVLGCVDPSRAHSSTRSASRVPKKYQEFYNTQLMLKLHRDLVMDEYQAQKEKNDALAATFTPDLRKSQRVCNGDIFYKRQSRNAEMVMTTTMMTKGMRSGVTQRTMSSKGRQEGMSNKEERFWRLYEEGERRKMLKMLQDSTLCGTRELASTAPFTPDLRTSTASWEYARRQSSRCLTKSRKEEESKLSGYNGQLLKRSCLAMASESRSKYKRDKTKNYSCFPSQAQVLTSRGLIEGGELPKFRTDKVPSDNTVERTNNIPPSLPKGTMKLSELDRHSEAKPSQIIWDDESSSSNSSSGSYENSMNNGRPEEEEEMEEERTFSVGEREPRSPLAVLNVNVGEGVVRTLVVHDGDEPEAICDEFVKVNSLPQAAKKGLINLVKSCFQN